MTTFYKHPCIDPMTGKWICGTQSTPAKRFIYQPQLRAKPPDRPGLQHHPPITGRTVLGGTIEFGELKQPTEQKFNKVDAKTPRSFRLSSALLFKGIRPA